MSDRVTIDRHLYLTEDQGRVVEEGDPAGRWLWAAPGNEVARAEAERLGAIKREQDQAEGEPESAAEAETEPETTAEQTAETESAPEPDGEAPAESQADEATPAPKRRTPRANKARRPAADKAESGE